MMLCDTAPLIAMIDRALETVHTEVTR